MFSYQICITRVLFRLDALFLLGIFHHMGWQISFHYQLAPVPNQKAKSQHCRLWNNGKFHDFISVVTDGKVIAFTNSCLGHETMTAKFSSVQLILHYSFAKHYTTVLICLLLCFNSLVKILALLWQGFQTFFLIGQNCTENTFLSQAFSLAITWLQHIVKN